MLIHRSNFTSRSASVTAHVYMCMLPLFLGACSAFVPHRAAVASSAVGRLRQSAPRRSILCQQDGYEAKNPLISLLGSFLPAVDDQLADIEWAAPKERGLTTDEMAARLDAGLRERSWFVTGRGLPELFDERFAFEDPDVSLEGFEPYCRQVRRLFDQETARMDVVCCAATSPAIVTVVWRLCGKVSLGPFGVAIKPYVVTTTLKTDEAAGGLVVSQEDSFSIPGYDILLSALLPPLRPLLAPEAPPVAVLASQFDPATCLPRTVEGGGGDRSAGADTAVEEMDVATRGVWYLTEAFGTVAAALRGPPPPPPPMEPPPADLDESIERLVRDYAGTDEDPRPYFLTGRMDVALYDEDCEFADPFVSFNGRERFVDNLSNLAGVKRPPACNLPVPRVSCAKSLLWPRRRLHHRVVDADALVADVGGRRHGGRAADVHDQADG